MNDTALMPITFSNEEFGTIRTFTIDNEPWFVGKDVAVTLGYQKPENAISAHVDTEDKTTTLIQSDGSNYKSKTTIINESGLYSLILSCKLESAKRFKRWVTSEVLPSIRKTGTYTVQPEEPDIITLSRAVLIATKKMDDMQKEIAVMKPKALFADTITGSTTALLVRQVAKVLSNDYGIEMGEKRLFQKLRDWGLIMKHRNEPRQIAVDNGWLILTEALVRQTDKIVPVTKVTPKGQSYILKKLRAELQKEVLA